MKRVAVIGCPGSGKTTFSEKLSKVTGLPLFYLDAIWHKPDRTHISREEFDERLAQILKSDELIIDGNYSRTVEIRIKSCDTVFLFDLPTEVCLQGAIDRLGKKRCDMPWIDTELDPKLREEIENFRHSVLPNIYALLEKYKKTAVITVFTDRSQADTYIEELMKSRFDKQKLYCLLETIPRGKVVTYGMLAEALGNRAWARAVGNALHSNPDGGKYPCYKVVNSKGELSHAYAFGGIEEQKHRLTQDGIAVKNGKVDLTIYGYTVPKND